MAINLPVAWSAWRCAARAGARGAARTRCFELPRKVLAGYVTIAISGACALGAEVVWTRLLGLMLGATVYTFSIILAVFLVGLGIGSVAGAAISRSVRPRAALGYASCC